MKQFAKLFERDGNQVLVTIGEDDPSVVIKFRDDECNFYVTPTMAFNPKKSGEDALNGAWKTAEKAFAMITEETAFDFRTKTLAEVNL